MGAPRYNILIMLQKATQEQVAYNRRHERKRYVGGCINNTQAYFLAIQWLLQYCKYRQLTRPITRQAKTNLQLYFASQPYNQEQIPLATVTCVWLATKLPFAGKSPLGNFFMDAGIIYEELEGKFTLSDIHCMESKITALLGRNQVRFTSPCDYVEPFFSIFPWHWSAKTRILNLIELSFIIPELEDFEAEVIFYSCFLAALKMESRTLNKLQLSIVEANNPQSKASQQISEFFQVTFKTPQAQREEIETGDELMF